MKLLPLALLLSLFASCASTEPAPLPSGDHIGEPMASRQVVSFATVDASPSDYFDQTVLVEATATAVCARKGCWMQVEDDGATAMVRWESGCGGQYTFPDDAIGKRILIQGSFYPKTISPEDAEHIEEEAGKKVDIPLEGYEFNASAVLVLAVE